MATLRKWFAFCIVVLIAVDGLANVFLFPHLPAEWQARFAYLTIVVVFVLGLVLCMTVFWDVVNYVFSDPSKKN